MPIYLTGFTNGSATNGNIWVKNKGFFIIFIKSGIFLVLRSRSRTLLVGGSSGSLAPTTTVEE